MGLSSVELISVKKTKNNGCVLTVGGADLADGTPIYDIKPYIAYTDSHPEAKSGFAEAAREVELEVVFAEGLRFPEELQGSSEKLSVLIEALKQDPRPAYIKDPEMPYGFSYAGYDVRFKVRDGVLTVFEISKDTPHVK